MLSYPVEWALKLEADHDEYMDDLEESVDNEDGGREDRTGEFFCGCSTCHRRASWSFLMERVLKAQADGTVSWEEEEEDSSRDTRLRVAGRDFDDHAEPSPSRP